MTCLKHYIVDQMEAYLKGKIAMHEANAKIYIENPTAIGEHSDIMEALEAELGKMGSYRDKLASLKTIPMEDHKHPTYCIDSHYDHDYGHVDRTLPGNLKYPEPDSSKGSGDI